MHLTLFLPLIHANLAHPGEMIDDARLKATRRLRYPKYRRDVPTLATRTHWYQPELPFAPVDLFYRRRVLRLLRSF
jgi:hypothetical protein